jgi:hypothetical protein
MVGSVVAAVIAAGAPQSTAARIRAAHRNDRTIDEAVRVVFGIAMAG